MIGFPWYPPMTDVLTGGCACGAVRYELRATPYDTGWCHCRLCQRSSGAPAVVFTTIAAADFSSTHGLPATWRSSDFGERGFCTTCGALLTIRIDFQPDTIDITAATLDLPEAVAPGFHIFCGDAIRWALLDDGSPRHEKFRPETRGLEPG
jgi:hypothetical protein